MGIIKFYKLIITVLTVCFVPTFLCIDINLASDTKGLKNNSVFIQSKDNIKVEFLLNDKKLSSSNAIQIEAGKPLKIGVRIADNQSNYGLSELHPMCWIALRGDGKPKPNRKEQILNIKNYLSGGVNAEGVTSLNDYYIVTLNADNTIAVINPLVNLSTSNLLALIPLGSYVSDWFFDEDTELLYALQPNEGKLSIVDLHAHSVTNHIDIAKGVNNIWNSSSAEYIWISNELDGKVYIIDKIDHNIVKEIPVGAGLIDLAFDDKNRLALIAASGAGKIFLVDRVNLDIKYTIEISKGILKATFSALSDALYVSIKETGDIIVIYPKTGKVLRAIKTKAGITALRCTPDGRYIFAVYEGQNIVNVIDTARNRVKHTLRTLERPDHVEFSSSYAYIRNRENANVCLLMLSGLQDEKVVPIANIPFGVVPPGANGKLSTVSPIAILPEGGGALIANPSDNVIYYYMESGMFAPSNSFKTYTSKPVGIIVYDHSMIEGDVPGLYEASVRLEQRGTYDLYFYLQSPRVVTSFEFNVQGNIAKDESLKIKPKVVYIQKDRMYRTGEISKIKFKLVNSNTEKPIPGLADVRLLSYSGEAGWQDRNWAENIGNGLYECEKVFPEEGGYQLFVEVMSLGIGFGDLPYFHANVVK